MHLGLKIKDTGPMTENKQNWRYLLTVDPSLTCSGWALFAINSGTLCGVGKIKSLKPQFALSERYNQLQLQIMGLLDQIKFGDQDILVCEAPTTMKDPKAAIKVEQVRGIFETLARDRGALVPGRLNPRTVHSELLGFKGKQAARKIVKEAASSVAHRLFKEQLSKIGFKNEEPISRHQDIVDALLIGSVILSRIKRSYAASIDCSRFPLDQW